MLASYPLGRSLSGKKRLGERSKRSLFTAVSLLRKKRKSRVTEAAAPGLLCCEGLQSVTLSLVCVSTRAIAAAQGLRDYREVLFYPMHDLLGHGRHYLPNSAVKPLKSFMANRRGF